MTRMPTMFIPHGGGPCFFMDWDPPETWNRQREFLADVSASLPEAPKALLVISGHWEEPQFTVQKNPAPSLLFDYNGFPPHTYELTWPAPGDVRRWSRRPGSPAPLMRRAVTITACSSRSRWPFRRQTFPVCSLACEVILTQLRILRSGGHWHRCEMKVF